jgi:hypothetical protein
MAVSVSRDISYAAVALTSGYVKIYRILDEEGRIVISNYNDLAVPIISLEISPLHKNVLDIQIYKK